MITPVTSLADLEFKAKTDKRYEQLAILGCKSVTYGNSRIKTYKNAIKKLHQIAVESKSFYQDSHCCDFIMQYINSNSNKIQPIVECTPVSVLVKKRLPQKIVDTANRKRYQRFRNVARRSS